MTLRCTIVQTTVRVTWYLEGIGYGNVSMTVNGAPVNPSCSSNVGQGLGGPGTTSGGLCFADAPLGSSIVLTANPAQPDPMHGTTITGVFRGWTGAALCQGTNTVCSFTAQSTPGITSMNVGMATFADINGLPNVVATPNTAVIPPGATVTITLQNIGLATTWPLSVSFVSPDVQPYVGVAGDSCSGRSLASGNTCQITVLSTLGPAVGATSSAGGVWVRWGSGQLTIPVSTSK